MYIHSTYIKYTQYTIHNTYTSTHTMCMVYDTVYVIFTHIHTHALSKKKDERPAPSKYTLCGAVGFSFGLGVARAGPYHRCHVGRRTRAFRSLFFVNINCYLIVNYFPPPIFKNIF